MPAWGRLLLLGWAWVALAGCQREPGRLPLDVPHGYATRLEVTVGGQRYGFGPFVGYYFRPETLDDLTRLGFVCFNERGFYAQDAPENALLFEGEAVLARLPPDAAFPPTGEGRIRPVFFDQAPPSWLETRPQPREEFVHFHSCYDDRGAALVGYWLRHVARGSFTYDMGGRVKPDSVLYHRVRPGVDRGFAPIVEFDRGPSRAD